MSTTQVVYLVAPSLLHVFNSQLWSSFFPVGSRLGAPFRDRFYLRQEYKSASKKPQLVQKLRNRITLLAFLNLIFCPIILLYQILYSFFSYAELLKRQPGVFGRRRWSMYGRMNLRDFNELDHELLLRLNRAYEPTVNAIFRARMIRMGCVNKLVYFTAGS